MKLTDLRLKEVISMRDGGRLGYVGNLEIEAESGQITSLIIPGRRRLFGLLGREADVFIPWEQVQRFGEDTILIDDLSYVAPHKRTLSE